MMAKKKRKSRATWLMVELPSNRLSYENFGDCEVERYIDYRAGDNGDHKYDPTDMQFEKNHPEELRLEAQTLCGILYDCTNWSKVIDKAHESHTEAFDSVASEDLGFDLNLEHDKDDTARIKVSVARRLLGRCKRDNYEGFAEIAKKADALYDPRYDVKELLTLPLTEWESEPLGWLLRAALLVGCEVPITLSNFERHVRIAAKLPTTFWKSTQSEEDFDDAVFYQIYGGEYEAWSNAVDWDTYDRKICEARQSLFDELDAETQQSLIDRNLWDGVQSVNPRCPLTLELPLGDLSGARANNL